MDLDKKLLYSACYEAARNTMFQMAPIDNAAIEKVAESFFNYSIENVEFIQGQNCDPNLLIRAVKYLAHTHAIPPFRDDTLWFRNMLDCLVELACPNVGQTEESVSFFVDIAERIEAKETID